MNGMTFPRTNIKNKMVDLFPAFTHRNFRLFWSGQIISLIGTWMQNTALNWLVYSITKDRFLLGLMSAVQFTPLLLFSLFAGIIIEKYPKRKLIILTQILQLAGASAIFIMVYTGTVKYSYILIILFFIGTVQALDNPARQSFVVEMVEGKNHLMNAIALNSAAFNSARLIGPAVAGATMARFGAKWCFFLNAVSFIAVIIGLFMMKMDDRPSRTGVNTKKPWTEIKEGFKFVSKTPKLLYTFLALGIINIFCINFNILIPPFTKDILGKQEAGYGILLSSLGLGALISAITVAAKGKRERAVLYQLTGSFGLAAFLLILGFMRNYYLSSIMLAFNGFFMIAFSTTSNSVTQFNSPDYIRGRVMSIYSLVFGGLTPIGSLYAGTVSKFLGPDNAFKVSGIIGMIGFLILFRRRRELK